MISSSTLSAPPTLTYSSASTLMSTCSVMTRAISVNNTTIISKPSNLVTNSKISVPISSNNSLTTQIVTSNASERFVMVLEKPSSPMHPTPTSKESVINNKGYS